jgi:hypothetical protein
MTMVPATREAVREWQDTLFWDPSQLWELYFLPLFYLSKLSHFLKKKDTERESQSEAGLGKNSWPKLKQKRTEGMAQVVRV